MSNEVKKLAVKGSGEKIGFTRQFLTKEDYTKMHLKGDTRKLAQTKAIAAKMNKK